MYVKVEPSGCCERNGMVQVRLCFYLEPGDYGYEKHYVEIDGKWQTNPFHNHFIYVEPNTTDTEIIDIGEAFLQEAYTKWATDSKLDLVNDALPFRRPPIIDAARIEACQAKVQHLKTAALHRRR